jgi:hypothetical protein
VPIGAKATEDDHVYDDGKKEETGEREERVDDRTKKLQEHNLVLLEQVELRDDEIERLKKELDHYRRVVPGTDPASAKILELAKKVSPHAHTHCTHDHISFTLCPENMCYLRWKESESDGCIGIFEGSLWTTGEGEQRSERGMNTMMYSPLWSHECTNACSCRPCCNLQGRSEAEILEKTFRRTFIVSFWKRFAP